MKFAKLTFLQVTNEYCKKRFYFLGFVEFEAKNKEDNTKRKTNKKGLGNSSVSCYLLNDEKIRELAFVWELFNNICNRFCGKKYYIYKVLSKIFRWKTPSNNSLHKKPEEISEILEDVGFVTSCICLGRRKIQRYSKRPLSYIREKTCICT